MVGLDLIYSLNGSLKSWGGAEVITRAAELWAASWAAEYGILLLVLAPKRGVQVFAEPRKIEESTVKPPQLLQESLVGNGKQTVVTSAWLLWVRLVMLWGTGVGPTGAATLTDGAILTCNVWGTGVQLWVPLP